MLQNTEVARLRNLRKLKFAITSSFAGNNPVVRLVFQALHDCDHDPRVSKFVIEGMMQGVKMSNMNETLYKVTASRVGKALALFPFNSNKFENLDDAVSIIWTQARLKSIVKLQREWVIAITDPRRSVCRRRLLREWNGMAGDIPAIPRQRSIRADQ